MMLVQLCLLLMMVMLLLAVTVTARRLQRMHQGRIVGIGRQGCCTAPSGVVVDAMDERDIFIVAGGERVISIVSLVGKVVAFLVAFLVVVVVIVFGLVLAFLILILIFILVALVTTVVYRRRGVLPVLPEMRGAHKVAPPSLTLLPTFGNGTQRVVMAALPPPSGGIRASGTTTATTSSSSSRTSGAPARHLPKVRRAHVIQFAPLTPLGASPHRAPSSCPPSATGGHTAGRPQGADAQVVHVHVHLHAHVHVGHGRCRHGHRPADHTSGKGTTGTGTGTATAAAGCPCRRRRGLVVVPLAHAAAPPPLALLAAPGDAAPRPGAAPRRHREVVGGVFGRGRVREGQVVHQGGSGGGGGGGGCCGCCCLAASVGPAPLQVVTPAHVAVRGALRLLPAPLHGAPALPGVGPRGGGGGRRACCRRRRRRGPAERIARSGGPGHLHLRLHLGRLRRVGILVVGGKGGHAAAAAPADVLPDRVWSGQSSIQ